MPSYFQVGPPAKSQKSETTAEAVSRRIDDHYHLQMTAENTSQLVKAQALSFRLQHDAAIANLRGMAEIANRQDQSNKLQDQTNSLLSDLVGGVDRLVGGMDRLNDNFDELNLTASETLDAVYAQTEVLQIGFQRFAEAMLRQQQTLEQIADVLRRPYETKVLELLQEADRALKQGMKSTGRDQKAEYTDATKLLADVLNNPIGSRNYVAWFQVGWLRWKHEGDIAEAEEAFYQASRLSAPKADLYYANSLRHMAYMQYIQGKHQDAYDSIQKAMSILPDDHDIRYDAARYAAKLGYDEEALRLLEMCIDQHPQTIVTMFSEEDFLQ